METHAAFKVTTEEPKRELQKVATAMLPKYLVAMCRARMPTQNLPNGLHFELPLGAAAGNAFFVPSFALTCLSKNGQTRLRLCNLQAWPIRNANPHNNVYAVRRAAGHNAPRVTIVAVMRRAG